jgi:hypothetical protein
MENQDAPSLKLSSSLILRRTSRRGKLTAEVLLKQER